MARPDAEELDGSQKGGPETGSGSKGGKLQTQVVRRWVAEQKRSQEVTKVRKDVLAETGANTLRVKLHSKDRAFPMLETHHISVIRGGSDHQIVGNIFDHKRMISDSREWGRQTFENSGPIVIDERLFAMH